MRLSSIGLLLLSILLLNACSNPEGPNELYFISTIHAGHNQSEDYSTDVLREIVEAVEPDVVLCELTPLALPKVLDDYEDAEVVTLPRIKAFVEYPDVVLPLWKEHGFEMRPVSAWSPEMAAERRKKLQQIRTGGEHTKKWNQYQLAQRKSNQLRRQYGYHDPVFIHSEVYDSIVQLWTSVYAQNFNEELGAGAWDSINTSHYKLIDKELKQFAGRGLKIALVFGAGHKGWIMERLKTREDVEIIDMEEFVKKTLEQ